MKAKLLKIVRKKVSLQERNGKYYIFSSKKLIWCRSDLAVEIFGIRLKKRIL